MTRFVTLVLVLLLPQCESKEVVGNAKYSLPLRVLDAALECRSRLSGSGRAEPVLLVHGTNVTRERNWSVGYWPALAAAGFEVCWVQLPDAATGDIQDSAEYVARAIDVLHGQSGELVDVVGHSQGGLIPRWSIKYFPPGAWVDDYVAFASPNHGTKLVEDFTEQGDRCSRSCWQMRPGSQFLSALNDGDETPGRISYTSIYTAADEVVTPPETARLDGASNIQLQDICPGRPVEHALMAVDALTWELTIDALTHVGPADPDRISRRVCFRTTLPGARLRLAGGAADISDARTTSEEPTLKPYARR
jgi:triacylglycerol lipase